jgi:hypothetical protein
MLPQGVALRYTSIIRAHLRMPGRVDRGGVYALPGTADSPPPNIATSAHAIVRYPQAAASSSVERLAPDGRRHRLERRFERRDAFAISDGCYLDSNFFTGANDPVESECRPSAPVDRKPSSQKERTAAAVLCASLLGLGLAFFASTVLIPVLRLDWSDFVCLGANSNPPQRARTDE